MPHPRHDKTSSPNDGLADDAFIRAFEAAELGAFTHVDHLRVAYLYAVRGGAGEAIRGTRKIRALAASAGAPGKFHETITVAWARVIAHLVERSASRSFGTFLAEHPELLNRRLLSTHYSEDLLFSTRARASFVEPDLIALP